MRRELTREGLRELMEALARSAPSGRPSQVYIVGGGTALLSGWRRATIDADLYAERDDVFRHVQDIKERLQINIEFVRPEDFVPALEGTAGRHLFVDRIGNVEFFHYDPYAQLLSKVVRGFRKDLDDAEQFVASGMVDPRRFRRLVEEIPESAWARYPALHPDAVLQAVDQALEMIG